MQKTCLLIWSEVRSGNDNKLCGFTEVLGVVTTLITFLSEDDYSVSVDPRLAFIIWDPLTMSVCARV